MREYLKLTESMCHKMHGSRAKAELEARGYALGRGIRERMGRFSWSNSVSIPINETPHADLADLREWIDAALKACNFWGNEWRTREAMQKRRQQLDDYLNRSAVDRLGDLARDVVQMVAA